jgi:hypothetical protein
MAPTNKPTMSGTITGTIHAISGGISILPTQPMGHFYFESDTIKSLRLQVALGQKYSLG